MPNKRADLGATRVVKLGRYTVGVRLPEEWCIHNRVSLGDPLYIEGELNGGVIIHTTHQQWTTEVKLRVKAGKYPIVTLPQDITRTRGLTAGDYVSRIVDMRTGSLHLRKVGSGEGR